MKHRGFTLVEIMIGIGILGAVGLFFLVALRGSGGEIEFGSEHFTAALLSQKVLEDCAQENFLNPYGFETLGIDETPSKSHIVDGASIFFSSLEDRKPPWGNVDPLTDGTIDKSMPALYRQTEKYELGTSLARLAPPSSSDYKKDLARLDVAFSWPSKNRDREFAISANFSVPLSPREFNHGISYSDEEIGKVGALMLFDDPDSSLTSLISKYGGKQEVIFSLARLKTGCEGFLYSRYFVETQKRLEEWINTARSINHANPSESDYRLITNCASASYEMAREAFRFIQYVHPDTKFLPGKTASGNLGTYLAANSDNVQDAVSELNRLFQTFVWGLEVAKYSYEILCQRSMSDYQDRKRQYYNLLKLMNIYRVLLIVPSTTSPVSTADYIEFWKHIENYSLGKNPALRRLSVQEIGFARNSSEMFKKNPTLAKISEIIRDTRNCINKVP